MFDKESHLRDSMDVNVVMSRAGGGLSKDKDTGSTVQNKDQKESKQVVDMRNKLGSFRSGGYHYGRR